MVRDHFDSLTRSLHQIEIQDQPSMTECEQLKNLVLYSKKMFNQDEGKIECVVGNREMGFWQGKKAENVLISFLTSGFAVFICFWLLVLPNSNNLINHVFSILFYNIPLVPFVIIKFGSLSSSHMNVLCLKPIRHVPSPQTTVPTSNRFSSPYSSSFI